MTAQPEIIETPRSSARRGRPAAAAADTCDGPTASHVSMAAAGVLAAAGPIPKKRKTRKPKPQVSADMQPSVTRGPGVWVLTFPAPDRMLSVNGNPHWRVTSPIRKTWREAMYLHACAAKLPKGLARVRIDVVLRFPTAGRRDAANYHGNVVKPLVDACGPAIDTVRGGKRITAVGYGLIPDDTGQYLDGPFPTIGEPVRDKAMPFGQVVVTITNLSGVAA